MTAVRRLKKRSAITMAVNCKAAQVKKGRPKKKPQSKPNRH
jgi:hypothetical protein